MLPPVIFPDLEEWLCGWLAAQLPAGTFVSNQLPNNLDRGRAAVIVRDDSGPDGLVTALRRIGVRVVGAHDAQPGNVGDLARTVAAWLRLSPSLDRDNPVAAVGSISGPYRVQVNGTRPEYYLTAELTIVGEQFNKEGDRP